MNMLCIVYVYGYVMYSLCIGYVYDRLSMGYVQVMLYGQVMYMIDYVQDR